MKLTRRRGLLLSMLFGLALIFVADVFFGPESDWSKQKELAKGVQMLDSLCDRWATGTHVSPTDLTGMFLVRETTGAGGLKVDFPSLWGLISGDAQAWNQLPKSIQFQKRWHFMPDGKDPYGNHYVFCQAAENPAIHPRTVFEVASAPRGPASLKTLSDYMPFSRSAMVQGYVDDYTVPVKVFGVDLINTILRASMLGQVPELRWAIHRALASESDHDANSVQPYYEFLPRSSAHRLSLLRLRLPGILQEVDATIQTLERLRPRAVEVGSGPLFEEHLIKYRAVREELERMQKRLEEGSGQ